MKNKISQKELAIYLGVGESAISEYKKTAIGKRKVFLMLKGLQKIKEEKELRQKS
jgi:predicted transcriptional regulator